MENNRGFTLIELLVVIAIIGIMASIAMVGLNSVRQSSRDARRKADIVQLNKALELYLQDNGTYPAPAGCISASFNGTDISGLQANLANYISAIPNDPRKTSNGFNGNYAYACAATTNNQGYAIFVPMEKETPAPCFVARGTAVAAATFGALVNNPASRCGFQ